MRKRAQAAEETRRRIIEAACDLLSRAGYHNVSLDQIAKRAEVSRQTIYVQFGSKRGVLQAVAEHIEVASYGRGMVEGAREVSNPVHTIRKGIGDQMRFFHSNADLLRTFYAQAANDPDFRAVWQERLQERWMAVSLLVERMSSAGWLAEGWSVEDATDWLWSLTNFQRYDELVLQRGWTPEQLAGRIVQAIDAALLTDGARKSEREPCDKEQGINSQHCQPAGNEGVGGE